MLLVWKAVPRFTLSILARDFRSSPAVSIATAMSMAMRAMLSSPARVVVLTTSSRRAIPFAVVILSLICRCA